MPANPWQSYRQIATSTAPPGQLTLMLYDGALNFIERAMPGFELNDPAERNFVIHKNLQRAGDIVRELNRVLNMEDGGQLASVLRSLYLYFDERIQESNLKKRPVGLDDVVKNLRDLRDAWAGMLARRGEEAADSEIAALRELVPA